MATEVPVVRYTAADDRAGVVEAMSRGPPFITPPPLLTGCVGCGECGGCTIRMSSGLALDCFFILGLAMPPKLGDPSAVRAPSDLLFFFRDMSAFWCFWKRTVDAMVTRVYERNA
jgi:hypothetical protein